MTRPPLRRPLTVALALLALPALAASPEEAPAVALHQLFDEAWAFALQEEPLFATAVGEHRYDDRLASMTKADIERRAEQARAFQQRLASIERARLSSLDRVSYDMFAAELRDSLAEHEFKAWLMPLNAEGSFHSGFARLPAEMPLESVRDYDNYIARLRAFPRYAEEHVALLREGLASGYTLPAVVMDGFEQTIRIHLVDDVEQSVFWKPFDAFPAAVPAGAQARLREAGRAAIVEAILPSYRAFLDFMVGSYIPGCRKTTGASELPNGRAYYAQRVRHFTTLDVTPDEVHQIGLREVARIQAEMDAVLEQVGWRQDFAAFLEFLRSDPRFYPKTAEELLARASLIAKRMDGKLPSLFGRLPRQPYGIEPVPADLAPKYTGGRYSPAPIDGARAGMYWVNTYNLPSRPFYTLEALTLHEAVPGHHLQMALTQELGELPVFRRNAYVDAFGEGWALYAERLGLEAGFYTDPYSDFGRLTYEMWRACRLVVDTGLHALGWTRQQAMDYLASHTALSLHEVRTETDRYIGWPGQALAYKMGELKIRELRARAERELGPAFDLRGFHDAVLASGTVPLPVLEEQIQAFVDAKKKEASR